MVDRINKIFAALAKVHAVTYILLGGMAVIFYSYLLDAPDQKVWFVRIGYAGICAIFIDWFITRSFYERYELGRKDLRTTNTGMVKRDTYFFTKINSNLSPSKKLMGYLYVLLRTWVNLFTGFLLGVILFLGVSKVLGL